MKYILNNSIVYDSDSHSLWLYDNSTNPVSLAIPASMCLMILIEKQGTPVSREYIHNTVWVERGQYVSINTVYQNISILRKSLGKLIKDNELIKTMPKRGVMIPDYIRIDKFPSLPLIEEVNIEKEFINTELKNEPHLNKKKWVINPISLCIPLIVSVFLFIFNKNESFGEVDLSEYKKLTRFNECHVFRNKSLLDDNFFLTFIKKNNITCGDAQWLYINSMPSSNVVSIFYCKNKLSKKNNEVNFCESHYYSRRYNEKV